MACAPLVGSGTAQVALGGEVAESVPGQAADVATAVPLSVKDTVPVGVPTPGLVTANVAV